MSMEFGCNFDRLEMDIVLRAVSEFRKNIQSDPNCSGNDCEAVLELEKKLADLAGYSSCD